MKTIKLMLLLLCMSQLTSAQNKQMELSSNPKKSIHNTTNFSNPKSRRAIKKDLIALKDNSDFLSLDKQDEEVKCISLQLNQPKNGDKYYMNEKERPVFSWSTNSEKKLEYTFQLFESNDKAKNLDDLKTLFEITTTKTAIKWPRKVKWPRDLKENTEKKYTWRVRIVNDKETICIGEGIQSFRVSNAGFGVDFESITMECKGPNAYNNNGEVCYTVTEKWNIRNGYSPPANFAAHRSTTHPGIVMSPAASSAVFTTAPGNSIHNVTYQYDICLPIGTTFYETELVYTNPMSNRPASDYLGYDSLDNCVCKPCEGWEIKISKVKEEPWVNPNVGQDYIYLKHNLNVSSPYGNIVRVDAEIVNYYHRTKEYCTTCNKLNSQHGTFIPYAVGGIDITNKMSSGFVNGNLAYYNSLTGTNSPPPSRNIFWRTPSPAGATMPVTSELTVGVPNYPYKLRNCCSDDITLCIRYTFTSYSEEYGCRKCSKIVCHKIRRDGRTIKIKNEPQSTY